MRQSCQRNSYRRRIARKCFALGTVSGTVSGFKGRSPKKTFKFCSDSICCNANSLREWQNWHSESSISLGKHAPGPLASLCTKRQFYPTKMQKSIKEHTRSNFPLRKKKWQTQVVIFHVFFLFMLGWGWGGIISINLGYKGGLPLPPKKISYEEGGGSSYTTTGYPSNPAIHPPPLKMNGPLAEEISLGNSIICSDIWHKYHEWYSRPVKFETILKYRERYLCKYRVQIMLLFVYTTSRKRFVAELSRAKRASGAPWVRKWSTPIRENLVITWPYTDRPPERPSVRTTDILM